MAAVRSLAAAGLLALLILVGCSSITVRRADRPDVTSAGRTSAVTGTELSERTLQTLRRQGLEGFYPSRLGEAVGKLHALAVADPHPDLLFALSEINFLRGTQTERRHRPEAFVYFYLAAGYAYHYLFDDYAPQKNDIQPAGGFPRDTSVPSEAFDPRFRLACDLYNAGLARCLVAAQQCGQLDPRRQLVLPTLAENKAITLTVRHKGFAFRPEEFGPVQLCSSYEVSGLANHHRTFGLGVPLIGSQAPDSPAPEHRFYPVRANFPITAFFRFEGSLAELYDRRDGWLELVNPLTRQSVKVRGRHVPLETDLTTPLAYYLAHAHLDAAGLKGFFRPDSLGAMAGLHSLEPYEPGKIPVVLVHGLLSSPITWAPLFNDLQADPMLRKRFQFWVYFYPTANPYLITAAQLRLDLQEMRKTLDPGKQDPALDDMVLVGHSMGGLVSRLLTTHGGDDFWRLVSGAPFDQIELKPEARSELRNTFYFKEQGNIRRAVFLGTPHRGSRLSPSILGRLGARLAGVPRALIDITKDVIEENAILPPSKQATALPTSVDLLAPDAPALQLLASRPKPEMVHYHSVIGVVSSNTLVLERLVSGTYHQVGDGVVPYTSAHLDDADSELVVTADHFTVHQHPLAVLEVRRILMEHLKEHDGRHQVIQQVSGKE